MFNRSREADNHILRVSRERASQQFSMCVCVRACVHRPVCTSGWLHPGSSIIFSLPHSPLGFHRLRLSDGEKQTEPGTMDTAGDLSGGCWVPFSLFEERRKKNI